MDKSFIEKATQISGPGFPVCIPGQVAAALDLSLFKFKGKARKGSDVSYLCHVLAVYGTVVAYGGQAVTQTAAVLHDLVEDTDVTTQQIETMFGPEVANIVAKVTEDKMLAWEARKMRYVDTAAKCCQGVGIVMIADKIDNLLAFSREMWGAPSPQVYWSRFKRGFADQLWFHQTLIIALSNNQRLGCDGEHRELRTYDALNELKRVFDQFRGGSWWTPQGVVHGPAEFDAAKTT